MIPYPHGAPRSEGVHVSSVIRSIAADRGILDPLLAQDLSLVEVAGNGQRWWDSLDEVSKLRMSMGLSWEQFYFPQLPHIIHQPGEMCVEGIYMTHDGESLDFIIKEQKRHHCVALHECKLTYKSRNTVGDLNEPLVKGKVNPNWMWLTQTKAYCKGLGTTLAYLHILYVCGDYSYPIQPLLDIWRIEYQQAEIDAAWDLIVGHLEEARSQETPTFDKE